MKFVCENCKAKYQIGDDKVAGKVLRMKCRRCGHMIQIAASSGDGPTDGVGTSMQAALTGPSPTPGASMSPGLSPPAAYGAPTTPMAAAPRPGIAPVPRPPADEPVVHDDDDGIEPPEEGATMVRPSPLFMMQHLTGGAGGAPRPGGPKIVPPARASLRATLSKVGELAPPGGATSWSM